MTGKFLTATVLLLAVSWFPGYSGEARAATLAVPAEFPTIQAAFEAARTGDRIELAPGRYFETRLILPNGIALWGNGDGPEDVIIDGQGQGRILLAESLDTSTLVANITFTNGRAAGHSSYESSGGAIFCSNSSLRIRNCIFENNVSDGQGGAIRCNNSTPLITGCIFRNNVATSGGGGAIDCSFGSSPLIRGCEFRGNTASWGGAISCRGLSSPIIQGAMFEANEATGPRGYGGAVFSDYRSKPVFRQSTFIGNTARYGGALACFSESETNLENCTLTGNTAQVLGGGVFTNGARPRITGSIIAFQEGTGISAVGGATPVITCTDIFGNTRGDWDGNLAVQLGVGDNINADPLFCFDSEGGSAPYALTENSPAGAPDLSCGYMGAWPVGCDAVGTMVSTFVAEWANQDAQLSWHALSLGSDATQFRLTGSRADEPDTEWDVPIIELGGGYFEATDPGSNAHDAVNYTYRLYSSDFGNEWTLLDLVTLVSIPNFPGIRDLKAAPNPFNPVTRISFHLGEAQRARVAVYDLTGRHIVDLANGKLASGEQVLIWHGNDAQGVDVGSGVYLVLVEGEVERRTIKVTLLK